MSNDDKKNTEGPINWAGVSTLLGAGVGSVIGLSNDSLILYTLIGALIGLWAGSALSKHQRK